MTKLEEQINKNKREIHTDSYSMSIGEVINLYRDKDLDIHPEFQRMFRWSSAQRTSFIESVLLGIPVPSFFVSQRDDGVWDVVDGMQRLSTILQFSGELRDEENKPVAPLRLNGTKYLPDLDGVCWEGKQAISPSLKRDFKREKLDFKIIKKESTQDTKYDLFRRLNTGGTTLEPQEVRNCLIIMSDRTFYLWIKELAKSPDFLECCPLPENQLEQSYDLELISRFIAFYNMDWKEKQRIGDIGPFLDDKITELCMDGNFNRDSFQDVYQRTFKIINRTLGEDAFKKFDKKEGRHRGAFSTALFELVSVGIAKNLAIWGKKSRRALIAKIQDVSAKQVFMLKTGSGIRANERIESTIPFGISYFGVAASE
ncbi:MAG: DUF262 domain-containing protein [Planctomycetota bacterium]|jgi:hypothetical protein|nr:DUF262 domain-containing protein [Planctomycetota bacterium]